MPGRTFFIIIITAILLPLSGCEKLLEGNKPPTDPVAVFEELWKLVDERYALFAIKGVDWAEVYSEFRAQVNPAMSEHELFDVLTDMLFTLKDGHVSLMSPTDTATYDIFYTAYPANFNYQVILNNYLYNDFETIGPLICKIVNNVGYIYYNSFSNDITEQQADELLKYISQAKGLIIDVRNNTGGDSRNVDVLFKRFIQEKLLVKYEKRKKGKGHDEFYEPEPYYLSPAPVVYGNPVILLTNRSSYSVCNDFALYMSQLPQVQLLGDRTGGGGAIPFQYILSNGWRIQYSGTMTLSADHKPVETGIEPDSYINITSADEIIGKDPIIEQAFLRLQ